MKRTPLIATTIVAATVVGFAAGQSSQPSTGDKLKETAADFGTTPAGLLKFVARELGEPLLIVDDGALHVGVRRDATRKVTGVQITTPERSVEFNLAPSADRPGMKYSGGGITTNTFGAATDYDGDGRIDAMILRDGEPVRSAVLLRLGERFEPSSGLGNGRFVVDSENKVRRFDLAAHEWIVDADQSRE